MTRKQAYLRLGLILLLFGGLTLAHSLRLPLHESPDEIAHFLYSRFIAHTGRLPLNYEEREMAGYKAGWPALYQAMVAGLTGWSDSNEPPHLKFVWQSPRFDMARELLYTKRIANTEDEFMPYRGAVLMWHLARLVSIGLSMGTIVVTFFTTLKILPKHYQLALVSAAIIAFIPIFIFISSAISDDALIGLLGGLYFLILINTIQHDTQQALALWKNYIWLGLLMGLAVTTKYSTVLLPVQVVGVVTYLAWRNKWGWPDWLKRVSVVAIAAIVASSWWFLTLIIYFNEIDEYGPVTGVLKPIIASETDLSQRYIAFILTGGTIGIQDSPEFISEPFWQWGLHLYQSFWVREIGNYPLGAAAQIFIGLVCVLAIIGWVKVWRRRPDKRIWITLFASHILLFLVFPFVRHLIQGNVSQTAQGRHVLFPTATVVPLLLVYGWQTWLSPKTQRRLALVIVGGLVCWSTAQLIRVIDYPLFYLPVRTTPEATTRISRRLDQTFGRHLILLGYDLEPAPADSALKIKLYWQSQAYVDEDYLMDVDLVQDGVAILSWSAYPINGRYPTRIWESWETIRDDLWLPLIDVPPGDYQVRLRLRGTQAPLPVDGTDSLVLSNIDVPAVSILSPDIPLPTSVEGRAVVTGVSLWQSETYRKLDLPEYRPRMAIPFVWQGQPGPDERVEWLLVDNNGQVYPSRQASEHFEYFVVGLDWPSGDYRLRVEVWRDDLVLASRETGPLVTIINKKPRLVEPPPIASSLEANFAGQVKLLGYDLPERSLSKGQAVPITLYWQGLRTMGKNYTFFTKLLDDQQRQWGSAERLPADYYSTIYWLENEVVIDSFELPVDPTIPPGIYWLNVGLYEEIDQAAVSLPLVLAGQLSDVTSVTLGPLKIGGAPTNVVAPDARPKQPLTVDLGDVIRLRGFDLTQAGQQLSLTLYWESLASLNTDYTVFVHVRNQANKTVAQMDRPPAAGAYPTSLWSPNELILDNLQIPLPEDVSSGQYSIVAGMYDFATGVRLPIADSADNSITLSTIVIR